MSTFLRAERYAFSEIFAGRTAPANQEDRLRDMARADARAKEKGYKDH